VLFYAADFPEVGRVVETPADFPLSRVGSINQSIRIEIGGALHKFGKLNKLVSMKQAEALI
jgi:8-hydroxy-5-deazaflavin:NADPH oxidoreductase